MKKLGIAFFLVLLISAIGNFVIHGMLLKDVYHAQSANLLRAEQDANEHAMFLMVGFLFFSIGFVWIYMRVKQSGAWLRDGLSYGVATWLIASVSRYAIYYAIQPWPSSTVWMQIGYELVLTLVLGLTVAFVMKD